MGGRGEPTEKASPAISFSSNFTFAIKLPAKSVPLVTSFKHTCGPLTFGKVLIEERYGGKCSPRGLRISRVVSSYLVIAPYDFFEVEKRADCRVEPDGKGCQECLQVIPNDLRTKLSLPKYSVWPSQGQILKLTTVVNYLLIADEDFELVFERELNARQLDNIFAREFQSNECGHGVYHRRQQFCEWIFASSARK